MHHLHKETHALTEKNLKRLVVVDNEIHIVNDKLDQEIHTVYEITQ